MIIKIPCDKCNEDTSVSIMTDVGAEPQFIVLTTDETNIERAVDIMLKNYWVAGIEYRGAMETMSGIDTKRCYIYSTYTISNASGVTADLINKVMGNTPDNVSIVLRVPSTFCNMRLVFDMCKEYGDRLRFDGGHFLNIPGCFFGEIGREHIAALKTKSKLNIVYKGACSTQSICNYDEREHIIGAIPFHSVYRTRRTGTAVEVRTEPVPKKMRGRPKKSDTDLQNIPAMQKKREKLQKSVSVPIVEAPVSVPPAVKPIIPVVGQVVEPVEQIAEKQEKVQVVEKQVKSKRVKQASDKKKKNLGTVGGLGTF